jgi:methyl-accepting chemotaxis protein
MSGLILLIIGLAGLALILAAFAYLGLKAWRLFKRGLRILRGAAPMAAQLAGRAEQAAITAERLAENTGEIAANLEHLQVAVKRLQVVAEAWADAARPYRAVRDYLGR